MKKLSFLLITTLVLAACTLSNKNPNENHTCEYESYIFYARGIKECREVEVWNCKICGKGKEELKQRIVERKEEKNEKDTKETIVFNVQDTVVQISLSNLTPGNFVFSDSKNLETTIDQEKFDSIMHLIFENDLNINPKEHAVIIIGAILNKKENRQVITQIMFETFNVPYLSAIGNASFKEGTEKIKLDAFKEKWISKKEYDQMGPSVINKLF